MWITNNFDGQKIWYSEDEYQELEQEIEELSYELDRKKDEIIYLKNRGMLFKTLAEYDKALKEIKNIANKNYQSYSTSTCFNGDIEHFKHQFIFILDIINGVIDNENN